jgi:hypothetical protein
MGCGMGIAGGRIGGWGIEGMADRVVRNERRSSSKCCFQIYGMSISLYG